MSKPQETATAGATEQPKPDSAPVAGDTQAGAPTAEDTQKAGGQPSEAAATTQSDDEAVPEGLTPETWAAMPKAEKKRLNQYFTQRTQKLSAKEKELEQTIAALNQVAESVKAAQPAVPPPPAEDALALQQIEQLFGPEAAQALDKLSQARTALVQRKLDETEAKGAAAQLKTAYDEYVRDNPSFTALEPIATQIAARFQPNGIAYRDYFKALHILALEQSGQLEAEYTKKVVERMKASAQAAEPASSGVTPTKVQPAPPDLSKMSISQAVRAAAEAAKRGERWNQ